MSPTKILLQSPIDVKLIGHFAVNFFTSFFTGVRRPAFCSGVPVLSSPGFPGKYAAAVVLPVKAVPGRQLGGALVAVLFLKIGHQIGHAVLCGQPFPDLVELPCIFQGTDGQRGGEIVELPLCRRPGGGRGEVRLFHHHAVHQSPEKCREAQRDRGTAGRRVRRALSDVRF